jgi:hypothetical protein
MAPPVAPEVEEQIVARERLRLLALGYYVKGAMGAAFISFLLFHFVFLLGFSFLPQSAWNPPPKPATTAESLSVTQSPSPRPVNQGPPVVMLRIFAAVIGVIILLGWTFGALTIYAGRCVQKRQHRVFIYVMAGLNCVFIPWGTLLGIATFTVLQSPGGQEAFRNSGGERPPAPF